VLDVQQGDSRRYRLVPQGASVQTLWTDADTPRGSGTGILPVHVARTGTREQALRSTLAAGGGEGHVGGHLASERAACVRTPRLRPASDARAGDIATVPRRARWRDVPAGGLQT
jgi:hypothetical protein